MFTGLVEALGHVRTLTPEGPGIRLVIQVPEMFLAGSALGDSVAINGCCLTVIEQAGTDWAFQAGAETLAKTNLGKLAVDSPVNLERPLAANGRLGGHFVQGHVDGVGTVRDVAQDGEWTMMSFTFPPALAELMVPKGSIAVDGVSLTVVTAAPDWFSVALIPHTLAVTTLGQRAVGDLVNLETDIIGKYVQRHLAARG